MTFEFPSSDDAISETRWGRRLGRWLKVSRRLPATCKDCRSSLTLNDTTLDIELAHRLVSAFYSLSSHDVGED